MLKSYARAFVGKMFQVKYKIKTLFVLVVLALVIQPASSSFASSAINREVSVVESSGLIYDGGILFGRIPNGLTPCEHGFTSCDLADPLTIVNTLAPCEVNSTIACLASVQASKDGSTWVEGTSLGARIPSWPLYSFKGNADAGFGDSRQSNLYSFDGIASDQGGEFEVMPKMVATVQSGKPIAIQSVSTSIRGVYVDNSGGKNTGINPDLRNETSWYSQSHRCLDIDPSRMTECWKISTQKEPIYFKVSLALPTEPSGWLNGRLSNPSVKFDTNSSNASLPTIVTISGQSVSYQDLQIDYWQDNPQDVDMWQKLTALFPGTGWSPYSIGTTLTPTDLNLYLQGLAIDPAWNKASGDVTGWLANLRWDGGQAPSGTDCNGPGFEGFVASNALVFDSEFPKYDAASQTMQFKVASPHLTAKGDAFQGSYSLLLSSDIAKCIWGEIPAAGNVGISVTDETGTAKDATLQTAVTPSDVLFQANGFTFSADVIRASINPNNKFPVTTIKPKVTPAPKKQVVHLCRSIKNSKLTKKVTGNTACPKGYKKVN